MILSALVFMFVLCAMAVQGKVVTEVVEYSHGDVVLEGYLAYDDAFEGARPGVLVVHAWKGLGKYEQMRARQLAELGYVAFAADIYGKGIRPTTTEEAGAQAGKYRADRQLLRDRVAVGMEFLQKHELCTDNKVAAIGYCFGGGAVLEYARSGADIAGVVSFHGNLDTPDPSHAKNIMCKVLVCHGAIDPHVKPEAVDAFQKEMNDAGVDYQFIAYSGAVHAFTDPEAGNDPSKGAAYHPDAARRSWEHMKAFFEEILK